MAEAEFFGLPLRGVDAGRQVISSVVIMKSFVEDSETGVGYSMAATDGLTTVEALGMMEYAIMKLKKQVSEDLLSQGKHALK